MIRGVLLLLLASLPRPAYGPMPVWTGYVTDVGTGTTYRVNGRLVRCDTARTLSNQTGPQETLERVGCPRWTLGRQVNLFGTSNGKMDPVDATRVVGEALVSAKVSGTALLMEALIPGQQGAAATMEADGYRMEFPPDAVLHFAHDVHGLGEVGPNVWMRYAGELGKNGTVRVRSAEFRRNTVSDAEAQYRKDDLALVAAAEAQPVATKGVHRLAHRSDTHVVMHADAEMERRVRRVGASLVPAYQQKLPTTDPTRVEFRFDVIDEVKLHTVWAHPNGVVEVPYQMVERLANDDELAELLATGIAAVLEKHALKWSNLETKVEAGKTAAAAAVLLVPGDALILWLAAAEVSDRNERTQMEQCARISLVLMRKAGYDVRQAPMTWWRMGVKDPKQLAGAKLPERTEYLYGMLATVWRERLDVASTTVQSNER